jgi:hypothetical protein
MVLFVAVPIIAILIVAATGCDSGYDDDYWYEDDHSYIKRLYIYLNVADEDGEALEGATVWVDGSQQADRTLATYDELGEGFPSDWRGWRYNWSGGWYRFDVRDCSGECTIEVMVTKSGWESQRTTITFDEWDPDEIYMRQTFVLEQRVDPTGVGSVTDAPQAPEIISGAQVTR